MEDPELILFKHTQWSENWSSWEFVYSGWTKTLHLEDRLAIAYRLCEVTQLDSVYPPNPCVQIFKVHIMD